MVAYEDGGSDVWSDLSASRSPPAGGDFGIAADPVDGYVLYFGGSGVDTNQTWTFSDGVWTNISSTLSVAPPTTAAVYMTYDDTDQYILTEITLQNQTIQTWAFYSDTWSHLPVQCRYPGFGISDCSPSGGPPIGLMADDSAQGYVLLTDSQSLYTWNYSNGVWTELNVNDSGEEQNVTFSTPDLGSMTYDGQSGQVLGFGGSETGGPSNTTWVWNGTRWINESQNLTVAPPARLGGSMAYDPSTRTTVLLGGWYMTCPLWYGMICDGVPYQSYADTWGFQNGTWLNLSSSSGSPGAMALPSLAESPLTGGIIEFGGATCPNCTFPVGRTSNSTWFWGPSNEEPIVNVTAAATPNPVDLGIPIHFSVEFEGGRSPITFAWSFGTGGTSAGEDPTYEFETPGT
ncbi:MAG: PKD domain-containing protein, partial [Thermoplasmata archaeon]|nr:PKD domain-containing protein [Thermoplasmata archaeon]